VWVFTHGSLNANNRRLLDVLVHCFNSLGHFAQNLALLGTHLTLKYLRASHVHGEPSTSVLNRGDKVVVPIDGPDTESLSHPLEFLRTWMGNVIGRTQVFNKVQYFIDGFLQLASILQQLVSASFCPASTLLCSHNSKTVPGILGNSCTSPTCFASTSQLTSLSNPTPAPAEGFSLPTFASLSNV